MKKITLILIICLTLSGCWLFPTPEPEPIPCAELWQLKIIYDGRYLVSNEVIEIPYNTKVMFTVQGFDVTDTLDACIDGSQVTWGASCPCTHWGIADGTTNMVWTNNSTLNIQRNVYVKYYNGITFSWRVEVI